MKKIQKILIPSIVLAFVMNLFLACTPPNNGGNTGTLAKPTITPSEGQILVDDTVTIETTETGSDVKIFYTINGDDPTNASKQYTAPFSLPKGDNTVKAIVYKGADKSEVSTAQIKVIENDIKVKWISDNDPVMAEDRVRVEISSETVERVQIYFLQGNNAVGLGTPVTIQNGKGGATCIIPGLFVGKCKFRAYKLDEEIQTSKYYGESDEINIGVSKPEITPNNGVILVNDEGKKIKLWTIHYNAEGVEMRYTTNGDEPTKSSTLYEGPFDSPLTSTGDTFTLKARTFVGTLSSDVAELEFSVIKGKYLVYENFSDKDLSKYKITYGTNHNSDMKWGVGSLPGGYIDDTWAVLPGASEPYIADSKMELITADLTKYKKITFSFDYQADARFFLGHYFTSENKYKYSWDGKEWIEFNAGDQEDGGIDLRIAVKEGSGNWVTEWHEKDDPNYVFMVNDDDNPTEIYTNTQKGHFDLDLSKYAGKTDITIAIWVIGGDSNTCGVDNLKILAEDKD